MLPFVHQRIFGAFCSRLLMLATVCLPCAVTAQSVGSQARTDGKQIYLLGEIHDNANGHSLRLDHVMQLIQKGHRPVVAMEQFDRENQAVLDAALSQCPDVDCVLAKAGTTGWEWRFYKP